MKMILANLGTVVLLSILWAPGAAGDEAPVFDIPRLEKIVIDGSGEDWGDGGFKVKALTYQVQRGSSPPPARDCDVRFRLGWNDAGLLLWVAVRDDVAKEYPDVRSLWHMDSVSVFVADKRGSNNVYQLLIAPGMDPEHKKLRSHFSDARPDSAKRAKLTADIAAARIGGGYAVEAMLPWANLGIDPKPGREIAMQIDVVDHDGRGRSFAQVRWYPRGGTYKDRNLMHRVRLATKGGDPVLALASGGYDKSLRTRVDVYAAKELLGEAVVVRKGDRKLADGTLRLRSGRPTAAVLFPMPVIGETWGALNVLVAGKDMGTIEMPDARAYRAGAIMNSQIKFKSFSFTGTELPGCDFEHPGLAADLMGPYRVSVQYFDRDFNEVTEAARPGRYGAVVTVEIKNRRFRRFHTLYCASTEDRPLRVHARRIEVKADISLPPGLGIDPAVVKENAGVLERSVRRRFQEEIENDPEIAVILAGLSEARPGDKTDIFSDLFARERQWWVTMKRKFYGLDKRYPEPLDPPRAIDGPPATTIREGTAAEAGVKPDAAEKIDAMLNQWAGDTDEAFAVCIVRRGVIVLHKAYGKRGGKPMTLETTSNMASITKMLGGVLTMMCVDQGRLDLEAPLDKVHPAFAGIDVATPATIRLLYSHWSGLSGHQGGLRNDLEEMVASYYPHLEVNKRYEYCSLDCALVGKFVEAVSGEALPQFYKRHLIDPLGLKHTEVTRMGFGTRSIPMDMARIGQMLLNRGAYGTRRFFSEETFRKMLPVGDRRGIGTVSLSESGLSDRTFGHPGASKATIRIDPENDLVIVMCRNSEGANYDKYHGKFIQTVVDGLAKE